MHFKAFLYSLISANFLLSKYAFALDPNSIIGQDSAQTLECKLSPCLDIVVTFDISGTISKKHDSRTAAAKNFLHETANNGTNRLSIVSFATKPEIVLYPTDDREKIHEAIDSLNPHKLGTKPAYTNMDSGLQLTSQLINEFNLTNNVIALLFSDFRPNSQKPTAVEIENALEQAKNVRNITTRFFSISFPGKINRQVLRNTGGQLPDKSYTYDEFIKNPPTLCLT